MAGKTQITLEDSADAVITRGGVKVEFNASGLEVSVDGKRIAVNQSGKVAIEAAPANEPLAKKVLKVGDRLKDENGIVREVVIAVDLRKNESLRVPTGIFGGEAKFGDQDAVVKKAYTQSLHGHKDWRRVTDDEGKTLSEVWDKVAPEEMKGDAAPSFWGASASSYEYGHVYRGGESDWNLNYRTYSLPVPVVRSGPARV